MLDFFFLQGKAVIFVKIIDYLSAPYCAKVVLGMQVCREDKSKRDFFLKKNLFY